LAPLDVVWAIDVLHPLAQRPSPLAGEPGDQDKDEDPRAEEQDGTSGERDRRAEDDGAD
jgi:hypothetical protein